MNKICTRCDTEKPLGEFRVRSKSADGRESACKACRRVADNKTYRNNPSRRESVRAAANQKRLALKRIVRAHLESNPCADCGLADADLLEFDHVRGEKVAGVGQLINKVVSVEVLMSEIGKCEVRCLHCHRKKTIAQLGWYGWVSGTT